MLSKIFQKEILFSEFADLGQIKAYSLEALKAQIKQMDIKEEQKGSLIFVQFSNASTKIVISYHLSGQFHKIESQEYDF